jgi:ABC-type uncharacterized transport system permease subunit
MTNTLLGISLVAYFIASALYLANLHLKSKYLASYGTLATTAGLGIQTVRLIMQTAAHATPFANAQEAIFFLSWAIALVYLILLIRFKLPAVGALAMPLALIALALVYRFIPSGSPLASGAWLEIHVVAIIISLALFILAFCSAIFYLVQNKLLKSKRLKGMFRKLPPLETDDAIGFYLAAIGFPLLTLGIITGIVGVETAQLRMQISWDKVTAAVATWIVYGAYLWAHGASGWRGKRANWILVIGAAFIAVTLALHKFRLSY